MCLYILGPYLNEGDCEVLLAFTKVSILMNMYMCIS